MNRRLLAALALVAAQPPLCDSAPAPKGAPTPELAFAAQWPGRFPANFLALSPSGKAVVAVGGDGVLRCWDADSGKGSFALANAHEPYGGMRWGPMYRACFSPDGKTLFTSGDDAVRLWDPAAGKRLGFLPGYATSLAVAPDGKSLVSANGSVVKVWDLASRKVTSTVKIKGSIPPHVGFGPEGRATALVGERGDYEHVGVYEAATGKKLLRLGPHRREATGYTFLPGGRQAAFFGCGDHTVRVWNLATGAEVASVRLPLTDVVGMAFTADGTRAAFVCRPLKEDGKSVRSPVTSSVKLFDLDTGKELWELPTKNPSLAAFSPDGRSLAVALRWGGVEVWKIPPRPRK